MIASHPDCIVIYKMWSVHIVDQILSRVLGLQINLYACEARLEAGIDPEALHDLRIAVRRLRSLLHPLRAHESFYLSAMQPLQSIN